MKLPKTKFAGFKNSLLFEIAWETCNQVGGIYTVIRSKVPAVKELFPGKYFLIGPWIPAANLGEFEEAQPDELLEKVKTALQNEGIEIHIGKWLVSGQPDVILFNFYSVYSKLGDIKYFFWKDHDIQVQDANDLVNQVFSFAWCVLRFFEILCLTEKPGQQIIAHFHEWMSGAAIPLLRKAGIPVRTVFTTHATLLGRYLAMNDTGFYGRLPFIDWMHEARHFNLQAEARIERAAAHGSHVFTTVSNVTAAECKHILGRTPDVILPNGINIDRFVALHEFQNLHKEYKDKIHQFVMGHFFHSYSFNLDKTVYFFISGRYEYYNKGFDLTIEAVARLNFLLKKAGSDITVVVFFITRTPFHSINPEVLNLRGVMEEIRQTCESIRNQMGQKLFETAASSSQAAFPDLNALVDNYWKLRLRRTLQSWKTGKLPSVVTHNLRDDATDGILNYFRTCNLINREEDKVKVVYHPDFINPANPLFGMEYDHFVRGCHLGIFPSLYEPWGYTPMECIVRGVPAVTSDFAGFGNYVMKNLAAHDEKGIYVIRRSGKTFSDAAQELAACLFSFVNLSRRERIALRNQTESISTHFDWQNLFFNYEEAYRLAANNI